MVKVDAEHKVCMTFQYFDCGTLENSLLDRDKRSG